MPRNGDQKWPIATNRSAAPEASETLLAVADYDVREASMRLPTFLHQESSLGILSVVSGSRRYVRFDAFARRKQTGKNPPNPVVERTDESRPNPADGSDTDAPPKRTFVDGPALSAQDGEPKLRRALWHVIA